MTWFQEYNSVSLIEYETLPVAQMVKNLPAMWETWVGKIPWRREWQPTPVFLPGESHEQRSLVGYNPWDLRESDTTEQLTLTSLSDKEF